MFFMSLGFLHGWLLLGLVGALIPPVVHMLLRSRADVVDWAAMQFLRLSPEQRRRVRIGELLSILLRSALLATLALALAMPFVSSPALARLFPHEPRDVALVIDGSLSMGYTPDGGRSAHEVARSWAYEFLDNLGPGDGVA